MSLQGGDKVFFPPLPFIVSTEGLVGSFIGADRLLPVVDFLIMKGLTLVRKSPRSDGRGRIVVTREKGVVFLCISGLEEVRFADLA